LVREVREQRKLSQQGLADLVGVGRRFISELENGKVTLEFDRVLQVAAACGIDVLARRR
jgi:y4mF family transcriptional regulator